MKLLDLSKALLGCLLIAGMAHAQGVGASGELKGSVTDPSGAALINATVTATDVAKGTKRTVVTDAAGRFEILGLSPAAYDLTVSEAGFQSEIAKTVTVNVGETAVQDFHLKLSQVNDAVEVTSEAPAVDTEKTSQADVISQRDIHDLPINRRDYLTFTLLAPGVADSTRVASDQDYRLRQSPQSGLSFYGSNGRGNSVTVDGGEANDDFGGVRLNVSQEAVLEFQINRSNYGAELGGASGATVNIVTKSGTNQITGSAFVFFRNSAFDAANPFSFGQAVTPGQVFSPTTTLTAPHVKDSLNRAQFGGSAGMPLQKNKTFLFSAFEGLVQDAQNAVPILTTTASLNPNSGQQAIFSGLIAQGSTPVPCFTGQGLISATQCATSLNEALTVNPFAAPIPGVLTAAQIARSQFLVNQLETNGGLFNFSTREYLASARLDHQFSDKNQVFVRYSFGHDLEESPDVQSLTGYSRGSNVHALDNTLAASFFHQFNEKSFNEARVQFAYDGFNVLPTVPGEVGLDIPGTANLGNELYIPSFSITRRYEFADNFSVIRGKHAFKFGVYELLRNSHIEADTFLPGRFSFGNLPGTLLSPCLGAPTACGLTNASSSISPIQSVALGLPQFYQQGFGNPVYALTRPLSAIYAQDTWSITPTLTLNAGLRYQIDDAAVVNTSYTNIAPRVSFAWDPFGDKKTVVRGGYGIFYAPVYQQIIDGVQTLGVQNGVRQIAQIFIPLTGAPGNSSLTSPLVFQTLFAQGQIAPCNAPVRANCITPADLTQFGVTITHTGAIPPLSVVFSGQPNYKNPAAQQAEIGVDRDLGAGISLSLSGIYVHTIGLPMVIDKNPLATAPYTNVPLANGKVASVHNFNTGANVLGSAPCAGAAILTCFANPLLLQDNVSSSKGSAVYEGGIAELRDHVSSYLSVFANYTFSKAINNNFDYNGDYGPQDNTNISAERALSTFDQRHKFVGYALIDAGKGGGHRLLANFQLSPIFRANSGHPFNLLAGQDIYGDHHPTRDRPIGVGRNTGLGPNFYSFDARLSRTIKVGARTQIQLLAEGFNLLNHTNFASVNSTVDPNLIVAKSAGGDGLVSPNVKGNRFLSPTTPLGFTSAFPSRQIQLGIHANF
jgi:hypothetical protein